MPSPGDPHRSTVPADAKTPGGRTGQPAAGPSGRATGQVRRHLTEGARAEQLPAGMPNRYKKLSAVDLFEQFLKVRQDFKGFMANGYGSSGWNVELGITFDAGTFILPGLLELSITGTVGGGVADSAIVCIHHSMPIKLLGIQSSPQQSGAQIVWSDQNTSRPVWDSFSPICLMAMFGKSVTFKGRASAKIGVGIELPEIQNGAAQEAVSQISSITEIPLAIGVGAEAGVSYTYDMLYAIDPRPGWYPNAVDQSLKNDFYRILYPEKNPVKQEILAWISDFKRQIYPLNDTTLNTLATNPNQLYLAILNKQLAFLQKSKREEESKIRNIFSSLGARAIGILKEAVPTNVNSAADQIKKMYHSINNRMHSTDGLLTFVDNLHYLIPPDSFLTQCSFAHSVQLDEVALIKTTFQGFSQRLTQFSTMLREFKASGQGYTALPLKLDNYSMFPKLNPEDNFHCFLKIASHKAEVNAGISTIGVGAYANAGITGSYKKTAYRYQTFTPSQRQQSLIYTQDTSITYRQAKVTGEMGVVSFGREKSKNFITRGMTYQSACAYWSYPSSKKALWVEAEMGSGVSYGVSVRKDELIFCVQELQKHPVDLSKPLPTTITSRRMIGRLAAYLRLPLEYMVRFLLQNAPSFLGENIKTPAVLLESNFAFPPGTQIAVYLKSKSTERTVDVYRMRSLWDSSCYDPGRGQPLFMALNTKDPTTLSKLCLQNLQSIRIRARMADFHDSATSFKLGIPIPFVSAPVSPEIKLSKIEQAGQEGVLEVDSQWFGRFTTMDYEECVPPVALFYQ